jgi:CHASE2 domain-containing sensor protein
VKSPNRIVLFAGLAATALVVLAGSLGLLDRIEWRTQDFRYRYARQSVDALGDRVRLVAIDDRALDTIGRWPWPRQTFARALDYLSGAHFKTGRFE